MDAALAIVVVQNSVTPDEPIKYYGPFKDESEAIAWMQKSSAINKTLHFTIELLATPPPAEVVL
jgi:hypothetical protein